MLTRRPSGRFALGAIVLWMAAMALLTTLGPYARLPRFAGGLTIPEERFRGAAAGVDTFLVRLGPDGRDVYRQAQWLDFLGALLLIVAGVLVLRWLLAYLGAPEGLRSVAELVPMLAGAADFLENLVLLNAIGHVPRATPSILPLLTTAKLGLASLFMLAVVSLALAALARRLLRPRHHQRA